MGKMKEINSSKGVLFGVCSTSYCTDAKKKWVLIQWQPSVLKYNRANVASWVLQEFLEYISSCLSLL